MILMVLVNECRLGAEVAANPQTKPINLLGL